MAQIVQQTTNRSPKQAGRPTDPHRPPGLRPSPSRPADDPPSFYASGGAYSDNPIVFQRGCAPVWIGYRRSQKEAQQGGHAFACHSPATGPTASLHGSAPQSVSAMPPIVTLTLNPAVDKNTEIGHVVAEDKLRCDAPSREPGGGGLNVSRVVDRLGGHSTAVYTSGGFTGAMLESLLDDEGLDHTPLPIDDWTRENLIVYETSTDRQFRFGMPGPSLMPGEVEDSLTVLRDLHPAPDYLVASGSLPPGAPDDTYAAVAGAAHTVGARPILDTSGAALREAMDAGWYLLKPNLRELEQLAGDTLGTERQRIDAARGFIERGWCEVVVLSMGASGALLITTDRAEHVRSPTVPIASRVGAGDSMVAGLTVALTRGLDLGAAVQFGVAAGAAAVMTPGTELCHRDDTERLFEQIRDDA